MTHDSLWSHQQIQDTLLYAWDTLAQSQLPFVLVGNVAYQAYHQKPFSAVKITVVVGKNYNNEENMRLLRIVTPDAKRTTDGWRIHYNDTPVWIKFLTRNYDVLKNPDIVMIGGEAFYIPNPFEQYWNMEEHFDL